MFSPSLAAAALLLSQAPPPSRMPPDHPAVVAPGTPATDAPMPPGHPPTQGKNAPTSESLLRELDATPGLRTKEKTFEVATSLAKLYYASGRTQDALSYLQEAEGQAKGLRSFFSAQKKAWGKKPIVPTSLEACGLAESTPLEERLRILTQRAQTANQTACARVALVPVLDVQAMLGNAHALAGAPVPAIAAYASVLEVDPLQEEALFNHAAMLYEHRGEDVKSLAAASAAFKLFAETYPRSPRTRLATQLATRAEQARTAGGVPALLAQKRKERSAQAAQPAPAGPPPLSQAAIDAVKNTERTPELEQGLSKLVEEGEEHLARGRYQEALGVYTRVVPFQPENGRAKAGMAWALVGLKRPMADRIWSVAVTSDPAAVEKLGDTLQAKNDASGAKALWTKLVSSAPEYPGKASLSAKLK